MSASKTKPQTPDQSTPLVLVADDSEDVRDACAAYLQYVGMDVVTAADGLEAIEMATRLLPDVIVMDMSMPGLDGSEATNGLKSRARTRSIPVIAVSAHHGPPAAFRAMAAGCDLFLRKPVAPRDLNRAIRQLAERRRADALA
jgi:two-component system, cell cycle response regulator DivK